MKYYIQKKVLDSALTGARNSFPKEFLALLSGEKKENNIIINKIYIPPLARYDLESASFSSLNLPFNLNIIGSFHSHPTTPTPSKADLIFFNKFGVIHFISSPPFNINSTKAFGNFGNGLSFYVVD